MIGRMSRCVSGLYFPGFDNGFILSFPCFVSFYFSLSGAEDRGPGVTYTKHATFSTELYPLPTSLVLKTEMNSRNSKMKLFWLGATGLKTKISTVTE